MEDLPQSVDVVIMGTGLPECILAAACSRSGMSVLHVDVNEYYGDLWASFSFDQLQNWTEESAKSKTPDVVSSTKDKADPLFHAVHPSSMDIFRDVKCQWHIAEGLVENVDKNSLNRAYFVKQSRKFNVDLVPKLILGRGSFTDTLIRSGVAKYLEFKFVDRILTYVDSQLHVVPVSRNDVFRSKEMDLLEKRSLMKFLTVCLNSEHHREQWIAFADRPAVDYLKTFELSDRVLNYVMYAYGMRSSDTSTAQFLADIQLLIQSSGAFGSPTPFLWPLYGCGDVAQAFSRFCAVYGGIYCLRCRVNGWVIDENSQNVSAVVVNNQQISCKHIICSAHYVPSSLADRMFDLKSESILQRTVFLSRGSILPDQSEHISLLNVPINNDQNRVAFIELGSSAMVVPTGLHIAYTTSDCENAGYEMEKMFYKSKEDPTLLWSMSYSQRLRKALPPDDRCACKNVLITSFGDDGWVMDSVMDEAERLFKSTWPDTQFFPPPDEAQDENDEDTVLLSEV